MSSATHCPSIPRRAHRAATCLFIALAGTALVRTAAGDDILPQHADCLTTKQYTAATVGQGIRPVIDQRGVNIDGSMRAGGGYAWMLAGNPFEAGAAGARMGDINLATGTYSPTDVDIALPAPGMSRIAVGRTFNGVQKNGANHFDSSGYQGSNWFQISQPEITLYDDDSNPSTRDADDIVYIFYGADRFLEFKRTASSVDTFQGINGAAGVVLFDSSTTPDTYIWTDQRGTKTYFFSDDTSSDHGDWQLWKVVDAAGNVAYVGDATTPATAVTNGYTSKRPQKLYDGAGRRYCYTYDGNSQLAQVLVETDAGGGWGNCGAETMVAKVEYAYYGNGETHGSRGDLKLVTITTPLTDSGVNLVRKKHYRYWKGAYDGSTVFGEAHTLKMVVGFEGCRKYDWDQDGNLDDDFLTASDANLKSYSDYYFENVSGSDFRIAKTFANGECGCGGGSTNGEHLFTYATNGSYTDNSGYDTAWQRRVVIDPPSGGTWVTQYFDEICQPISRVLTDVDPASGGTVNKWPTQVVRDSTDGTVTEVHTPANITAYTHSTGAFTASSSVGLVWFHERISGGDTDGFLQGIRQQAGTTTLSSTSEYVSYTTYTTRDHTVSGSVNVTRPMISARRAYHTAGTNAAANNDETSMSYSWWSSTASDPLYITLKQTTTTNPVVTTGTNGSNSATVAKAYHRKDATVAFTETPLGRVDYMQYTNGQLTKRIDDAKTDSSTDFAGGDDPNGDFGMTETSSGWARTSTFAYDAQGRSDTSTAPDGRISKAYYSRLEDHRPVSISYPRMTTGGSTTFFGPAGYSVSNQAGRGEFSGTIAITAAGLTDALTTWIDEGDDDPITALDKGTLMRMSTRIYSKPGTRLDESRVYFNIPASGAGSTSNYDATAYTYDDVGRQCKVLDPTGTIHRTTFDSVGRTYRRYIGTDDSAFPSGGGSDNMVKIEELEYDSAAVGGNSHLTSRTLYVEDSTTDQRITTYLYDYRGRLIVTLPPVAPYSVAQFDNLGRSTAMAQYSSTSGLDANDNPVTLDTNRTALSRSYIDSLGRVYKSTRHKIDQSDGSDDDNLETLTWRDGDGRVVKVDGSQLTKTLYDRLGRVTHQFILAKDNDAGAYADADDVTGDIVLEESQTTFEGADSNNVVMRATISRFHDDLANGTTGALDTNADANTFKYTAADVDGRIQITAMWYDDLDRVTDTVAYGNNGASSFDRKPSGSWLSVPSRSATELVTTSTYDTDGTVLEVTDPKNIKMRWTYDHLGRKTAEVKNYVNGTPTGPVETATDDVTTRFEYSKGLQTKVWVDFDADGVVDTSAPKDQVTTYIYGGTKATPTAMKIATGHLLRAIKYPETTNAGTTVANIDSDSSDVVSFAYNAQGQTAYQKDQGGNVIATTFDTGGRETAREATTVGGGFDGTVRKIAKTYLTRGLLSKITQYDVTPAVVDDLKYAYDGWGNITSFKQDVDSDIDVSPSGVPVKEVTYTWAKAGASSGRNTLRKTDATYAGASLTYTYLSSGNSLASDASRVSEVKSSSTIIAASYNYNGLAQLVGTDLVEPDARNHYYEGAGSGSYPDLDNFNRVTSSRWTKYGISPVRDFVDLDLSYDEGSNITLIQDNVHTVGLLGAGNGLFDAKYTLDALNRVTQTKEGNWNGSSINVATRDETWTLTQTGNWNGQSWDFNGNGSTTDVGDMILGTQAFNEANEWTSRQVSFGNGSGGYATTTYTPTHDGNGNMTSDNQVYKYEYDAFNRLRKVKNQSNTLISEYKYNGLGFRVRWTYDTDADLDVDANDQIYTLTYDEQWRIVAVHRGTDSNPKERYIHHNAGLDGRGGSSYIDAVILRDRDHTNGWTGAADGTLEQRAYYTQNWRADVSAFLSDTGKMLEFVKYSSYGTPRCLPSGDTDSDGDWDTNDSSAMGTVAMAVNYDVRHDADLNGTVDASADPTHASSIASGWQTLGYTKLSSPALFNRIGYAGYAADGVLADNRIHHVRHRVHNSDLGRWLRRDPVGYHDGMGLYEYARSTPVNGLDPYGLLTVKCGGSGGTKSWLVNPGAGQSGCGDDPSPDCTATLTMMDCLLCCAGSGGGTDCENSCFNEFAINCPPGSGVPIGQPDCKISTISNSAPQYLDNCVQPCLSLEECNEKKGDPCTVAVCFAQTTTYECTQLFICKGKIHKWKVNQPPSVMPVCESGVGVIVLEGFPPKCKCCDVFSKSFAGGCGPICSKGVTKYRAPPKCIYFN